MKDSLLELEHKSRHVSFIDKRTEASEVSGYQSKNRRCRTRIRKHGSRSPRVGWKWRHPAISGTNREIHEIDRQKTRDHTTSDTQSVEPSHFRGRNARCGRRPNATSPRPACQSLKALRWEECWRYVERVCHVVLRTIRYMRHFCYWRTGFSVPGRE